MVTAPAARVRITAGSGDVYVVGETRDDIDVDGADVEMAGLETEVRGGSDDFTVRVPTGTDVVVGSASGDVSLDGPLGAVSVTTESADIRAEEVASIDARTASGKLTVDLSHGPVRLKTKSARIDVGRIEGDARIAAVSGRISIADAHGRVSVKTVSGDIGVVVTGRAEVRVETISGTIKVAVPDGVKPAVRHRSVSGRSRVEPAAGDDVEITARSVSGDITVGVA